MTRVCSDCPALVSERSKGRCRACVARANFADPAANERRLTNMRAALRTPESRQRKSATRKALEATRANDPYWIAHRKAAGQRLRKSYDAHPDAHARNMAQRGQAGLATREAFLGWCPVDRRDEYQALRRKVGAKDARALIEETIPGTKSHAARVIANTLDGMRIKQERQRAQAY